MTKSQIPVILAVDFDGTIAQGIWPALGEPLPNVVKYMQKLKADGFYIGIWTCRTGDHIEQIERFLHEHEIPFDNINKHHPALCEYYGNDTRKVSADIYIDDRNLGGLPDWSTIYNCVHLHVKHHLKNKVLWFLDND